jgi:hypothetical protein
VHDQNKNQTEMDENFIKLVTSFKLEHSDDINELRQSFNMMKMEVSALSW